MLNLEKQNYNVVASEKIKIGRFEIVHDTIEQDGKEYPYSYVKMKRGVGILGMVDGMIILLKQYRYIWDNWFWEIPGGMVDDDETPEEAAIRELEEETGFCVKSIKSLGTCYPSIGSTTELQYLYVAECENIGKQNLDSLERINVSLVSVKEFELMIEENEFSHGMGLSAWARYKNKLKK